MEKDNIVTVENSHKRISYNPQNFNLIKNILSGFEDICGPFYPYGNSVVLKYFLINKQREINREKWVTLFGFPHYVLSIPSEIGSRGIEDLKSQLEKITKGEKLEN